MKITENVFVITLAREYGDPLHLTLLRGGDRVILVDAGFPGQYEQLKEALALDGFLPEQITDIILTHQDIDHIGCIGELKQASPGLTLMAHMEEAPYIDGTKTPLKLAALEASEDTLPEDKKTFLKTLREGFANRRHPVDRTLLDGDVLPLCSGIRVFHVPGHTPGHICLLLPESGILVTGDALNTAAGELTGPNPVYTADLPLAMESLVQLLRQGIAKAITYHCGIFEGDFDRSLRKLLKPQNA